MHLFRQIHPVKLFYIIYKFPFQSLNGVYVNSEKTKQNEPVMLKDSDEIQLGVSSKPGVPPEFVWRFHTSLKVKKMKPGAVDRSKSPSDSGN